MNICQAEFRSPSSSQTAFHGFEFQDVDNDGHTGVIAADYAHGGNRLSYAAAVSGCLTVVRLQQSNKSLNADDPSTAMLE